ncbi:MAG: hypothetical protein ACJ77M_13935 [Thermoleophilaceae bacterium]
MPRGLRLARNMDIALLAAALPIFLLGDLPIAGWAVGAGAYVIQRIVRDVLANQARKSGDPRSVAGILVASMLGRGFLIALTLLGVGLAVSNKAGLCAAVLFLAAFTISFGMGLALRPFEEGPPRI